MIRERDIEAKVTKWARDRHFLTYKFVSPSQRGVPDRVFIRDGYVIWIEFKAPGKKPTPLQAHTIKKMQDEGCRVYVFDNAEDAIAKLEEYY